MCQKRNSVNAMIIHFRQVKKIRVDPCIRHLITSLTNHGYNTVACCCGHDKYPMTIVYKTKSNRFYELISGTDIPRKRRFYRKDSEGYYYIPEVNKLQSLKGSDRE